MDKKILKFWRPGCVNCKVMEPTVTQLEEEYPGITFKSVNTAQEQEAADKYNIQSLPTLVFLKDGEEVGRLVGLKPKSLVIKKITEVF